MKKNLQNAMAKNFQKMVNEQPSQTTTKQSASSSSKETKKAVPAKETVSPVIDEEPVPMPAPEPVVEENIPVPVQPEPQPVTQTTPVVTPVVAQVTTPNPSPAATVQTTAPIPVQMVEQPQQSIPVPQPQYVSYEAVPAQSTAPQPVYQQPVAVAPVYAQEPVKQTKSVGKKPIPLMPEEKSSGVLHIRLGELRSYVDFMTQSGKISYQQYISNLIEQDYEKNKDMYLKYKSFMDQLNM